jgi:hypothetical protein
VRAASRSPKVLAAAAVVVALALPGSVLLAGAVAADGPATPSGPQLRTIFSGATLGVSQPDDIVTMDGHVFVGFQNGVGPQGEPNSTGGTDGTVVEMSPTGVVEGTWSLTGKIDGMAADPGQRRILATVNEDLNSSLFTIDPTSTTPVQYTYAPSPLPHNGGTDSLSVVHGTIYVAASAPGTAGPPAPQPTYPAVYSLDLNPTTHVATATPVFSDEATAVVANTGASFGQPTTLGLTDPDSTEVVPPEAARFGGQFVLDSQGDQQQIYVNHIGGANQTLSVLALSQSIDDTAWATAPHGTLFITDHADNLVDVLQMHFDPGTAFVATTPCNANSAPSTCTTPNYLGTLDLHTGTVSPVDLGIEMVQPVGLAFMEDPGH